MYPRRMSLRRTALAVALLALTGCAPEVALVGKTPENARIVQIPLRLSNAYVVHAARPVLIDAGTIGDLPELERGLAQEGLGLRELAMIIVTHAHGDHAGLAAELRRRSGAIVVLGQGDADQALRGENDPLHPTRLGAALLKPFIPKVFPSFTADTLVSTRLDLRPWGIGGDVVAMPGHTAGSVVVVLDNHTAFVGDILSGGAFGGLLFPTDPGEHYYQADVARNHANIRALLDQGIERFYLGHGGPVIRADVERAFPK